jgi:hypothetical protein
MTPVDGRRVPQQPPTSHRSLPAGRTLFFAVHQNRIEEVKVGIA